MPGFPLTDLEQNTDEITPGDDDRWTTRDALWAVAAFIVIAFIASGGYLFYQSRQPEPLREGSTAPNFSLPLLHGSNVSLSDYKGKVVVINIWASWCNPCREEMPSMEMLYKSMQGKPFEILAVSVDARQSDAESFANQLGLTFPILMDPDKNVFGLYQATGQPESFIIDKHGKIVKHIIGPLANWNDQTAPEIQLIQQLVSSP